MVTRIEKSDLARDALYEKVNTMVDELNTKIDNKDSLPSQTGKAGKFLTTDGTNASWGEVKQIEIKQNLTNPSADTVPSTKAVKDESSRITTLMNTKISNCITEIPQDIKLELNNGTLTLKAGSKVYIPNGFEADGTTPKFDIHIISSDKVIAYGSKFNNLVIVTDINDKFFITSTSYTVSGATQPTDISRRNIWYDTTTNTVKTNSPSTSNFETNKSLPIAIINCIDINKFTISQVFNGFGYIGSTVYALPGVKGLIPNGRNADGSLNNIEFTVDRVQVTTNTISDQPNTFGIRRNGSILQYTYLGEYAVPPTVGGAWGLYYNTQEQTFYFNNGSAWEKHQVSLCGKVTYNSSLTITSFTPKTVFHALDYNDSSRLESAINNKVNKSGDTMTGSLIITGDGWNLYMQSNSISYNTAPSSRLNKTIAFVDKNAVALGAFEVNKNPENINDISFNIFSPKGSWCPIPLGLRALQDGSFGTMAPRCNWENSIVTTVSHGSNYVRFGNGLQICWGSVGVGNQTATFQQPFKNADYSVSVVGNYTQTSSNAPTFQNKNTTNFQIHSSNAISTNWIAIGYWY